MNVRNTLCGIFFKTALVCIFFTSFTALAFTQFVEAQSTQHVAALIYALLGVMSILFITPLVQFYHSALRNDDQQLAFNEQLRVFEQANTGIIYVSAMGEIIFANQKVLEQLGKKPEQVINQAFAEQFKGAEKALQNALTSQDKQTKVHTKLGQAAVDMEFSIWLTHDKHAYRIVTLNFEQSKVKDTAEEPKVEALREQLAQTQSALQNAEKKLQQLIDLAPVGIGRINKDHQIISANQSLIERLNYPLDELKKGNIYKLFNDATTASQSAKRLNKDKKLHLSHLELTTRNGESAPTELTIDLFDPEREEYVFWMINYCDEQFQYDKFNALLENTGLPVAILTDNGFSKFNKQAYRFFQFDKEKDLKGVFPYSLALNQNKASADQLATSINTIKRKGGSKSLPWSHSIDGQTVPCELSLVPVYKNNQLDAILCIWTDLREREQAAVELSQLSAKFAELNTKYEQKRQQLNEQEQSLSEFELTQSQLTQLQADYAKQSADYQAKKSALTALQKELVKAKTQPTQSAPLANDPSGQQDTDSPQNTALRHTLEQARAKITAQEQTLIEYQNKIDEMEHHQQTEQAEISALHAQIDGFKQSLEQKQQTNGLLEYHVGRLETEHENATHFITKLTEQLNAQRKLTDMIELQNIELSKDNEPEVISQLKSQLKVVAANCAKEQTSLLEAQAKLETELASTETKLNKAQKRVDELSAVTQQLEQDNNQHTQLIDDLMLQLTTQKEAATQQQNQFTQEQQEQQKWQQQDKQSQQNLASVKQTLSQEQQLTTELKSQLQSSLDSQQETHDLLQKTQADLSQIKQQLAEKQQQQHDIQAQLESQKQKEQDHLASIHTAKKDQSALRAKLHKLETQLTLTAKAKPTALDSRPDIEKIVLPNRVVSFFDLNHFWSNQPSDYKLSLSLKALLDEIDHILLQGDEAVQSEKLAEVSEIAQQLLKVSKAVNAEQLIDLAQNLSRDCRLGKKDNALVRWQPTKQALQKSQRIVYEQLQHV